MIFLPLKGYFAPVHGYPHTTITNGISPVLTIFSGNLSGRWTLQMSRLPQQKEPPVMRQQIW
jgi:hypothetical protein